MLKIYLALFQNKLKLCFQLKKKNKAPKLWPEKQLRNEMVAVAGADKVRMIIFLSNIYCPEFFLYNYSLLSFSHEQMLYFLSHVGITRRRSLT